MSRMRPAEAAPSASQLCTWLLRGHPRQERVDGEDEPDDERDDGVAEERQGCDPRRRFVGISGEFTLGILVDRRRHGVRDDEQQRHDEREEPEEGSGLLLPRWSQRSASPPVVGLHPCRLGIVSGDGVDSAATGLGAARPILLL
jgi:hypothetical protein